MGIEDLEFRGKRGLTVALCRPRNGSVVTSDAGSRLLYVNSGSQSIVDVW
jgi:hypothetical protein